MQYKTITICFSYKIQLNIVYALKANTNTTLKDNYHRALRLIIFLYKKMAIPPENLAAS